MSELLSGIRVVESASLLNGDAVGMLLGDAGAEVIKIEQPGVGDYLRHILGQVGPDTSPSHVQFNRNKRSITLDLRHAAGRAIFFKILEATDVFIDGNTPGTCEELGIGYPAQRAHKPDIVYCACTGYGASGPYSRIPTHSMMMNALVGCCPTVMQEDGLMRPADRRGLGGIEGGGAGPTAAAPHAAFHISAALVQRSRTGAGCYIDVAGSDAVVMGALNRAVFELNQSRLISRAAVAPLHNGVWQGARYQFYETRDRRAVLFACIEPRFWRRFCTGIGREDLIGREGACASEHMDFGSDEPDLRRELQTIIGTRYLSDWLAFASEYEVPIGPAHMGVVDAQHDPQLRSRSIFIEGTHPDVGEFTYIGSPARVFEQDYAVRSPAPRLGEHTHSILAELGYSRADIEMLASDGVV